MVPFKKYTLSNGLKVILCPIEGSSFVTVNLMYDVGARDEKESRTGFAHLFEHLMFGGTPGVPDYDQFVENSGGNNNAFTSNDLTNYYVNMPSSNLEVGLWLEADRMKGLSFTPKSLEIQRQVVVEEFKQRYLNQPYGDVYLLMRPLAYQVHPYKWPTIGKEISHIEEASMEEVKDFFYAHYAPNNAVLCLCGGFEENQAEGLIEKHFGQIEAKNTQVRSLPQEPEQAEIRRLEVERNVPASALFMAFHMVSRDHEDYPICDILSDILGYGDACRLHQSLVEEQALFSSISCYVGGDKDPGLFYISGHILESTTLHDAEKAVWNCLQEFIQKGFREGELERNKQKFLSRFVASQVQPFHLAVNLCYYELLSSAEDFNQVVPAYKKIGEDDVLRIAKQLFRQSNTAILHYKKQ